MNINIQTINHKGKPAFVVLPIEEYKALLASSENLEDTRTIQDFQNNPTELFPRTLVDKLANNENPIKTFRTYRKLTQSELAKKAQISKQYISQLEKGDRNGGIRLIKKIAKILKVDLDMLT
jgi:DNA-binding XRE family transcriptional regulator